MTSFAPQAVLISHSGSTSGQPMVAETTRAIRKALAKTWIIYGGVFPTYHWRDILADEPQINFIVRGEGEDTAVRLIHELETGSRFPTTPGIAYWYTGRPFSTPPAQLIRDLDAYRVGWELIEHSQYTYWGDRRAVVVQFSRGCPHLCNYCGQRGFWTKRHYSKSARGEQRPRIVKRSSYCASTVLFRWQPMSWVSKKRPMAITCVD